MKENIKQFKSVYLILGIIALALATSMVSFAYFSADKSVDNNANLLMKTGNGSYTLIVETDGNIEYDITLGEMFTNNVSTEPVGNDNANILISLKSPDENITTICTYDLTWTWLTDAQYTEAHAILPLVYEEETYNYEFSISAIKTISADTSGYVYSDSSLLETDLSNFEWSKETGAENNSAILIKNAQIASRSETPTEVVYQVDSRLYNIPAKQNEMSGKNYQGKVAVENIDCKLYEETPI